MTVTELNNLINNNVYDNTSRAISGGVLQTVLQGMMGCFFGTSSLSGIGQIATKDMRDAIGSTLGGNSSLISSLANNLATNSTFGSNLVNNITFVQNLSTNYSFATNLAANSSFATSFAINSTFGGSLVYNSAFTMKLSTDNAFCSTLAAQISPKIATSNGFQSSLNCRYNYYTGTIPYELVYNSSFISGLKSQLGL